MTDSKPAAPAFESPIRIEVTADATASLEQATDTAASFVERVVMPPAEAVSRLAVDLVECLRGPFRHKRIENLAKLGKRVRELQDEQGVTEPLPLPPKSANVVIEQGSFEEDDALRELWAQLIVNTQAGMPTSAYLFELLSKLDGADAQKLLVAARHEDMLPSDTEGIGRLVAVGLLQAEHEVSVHVSTTEEHASSSGSWGLDGSWFPSEAQLKIAGFVLSDVGEELVKAALPPESS